MGDRQQRIQPRTLKGFRDYLPEAALPREWLISRAREVYRSYGFSPIDTPALEYEEILAGKGGEESEKQMFRFEDAGGRRVAMRFDLTVPLARFVAQYAHELGTPFKRYHIGPVWRGEKPQKGRYREFLQCDFDTVGTESAAADIESGLVIADLLEALGFEAFTVRVNDRRVLAGLLESLDLVEHTSAVLRALDKLDKIGPDAVREELERTAGIDGARA
ncbi:MAG: ATP phosphoribosyltransferase regulatory subunit, partial [Planctomycetota bacterium]|nr:ATP phosphoribosyltransferase regulatory subunit [Planctomycetota bacterium]